MVTLNTNKKSNGFNRALFVVICIVLSIVCMFVWFREGNSGALHLIRNGIQTITTPLQYTGSLVSAPFRAVGNIFHNITAEEETLRNLEKENEELKAEVIRLQEENEENERLASLIDIQEAYSLESTGARVIGQSSDAWNRTITIDKGSAKGIEIGMPVMSANGLIGQVESVSLSSATVRLVTDASSGVACVLQTSRAEGILTGSVEGLLYMNYVSTAYNVSVGDAVVTSGLGGIFPKGIVIGEVADVDKSGSDLYYTILVEPITRVKTYEEVLVVTGKETDVAISTGNTKVKSSNNETIGGDDSSSSDAATKEDE